MSGLPIKAAAWVAFASLLGSGAEARAETVVAKESSAVVSFPHRIVRLENGLTLVMQPDPLIPNIGVELWIGGGKREERPSQYGIAHLFEHQIASAPTLVGTNPENRALIGRTMRGGGAGTDPDYLNIYRQVAPEGVEAVLASLADQMEVRPEKYTEERLRKDRDIVVSELRRNHIIEWHTDVLTRLRLGTFGDAHPYAHFDSERDVKGVDLRLVHEWAERFTGAAQATLFVVGNFDPAQVEPLVRRHFGPLQPGPLPARATSLVPEPRPLRETMEAPFPKGRVFLQWPTPGWGTEDGDRLILLAQLLENRLQSSGGLGSSASAGTEQWQLAGLFGISAEIGTAPAAGETEARLSRELKELLRAGPSPAELARAKAKWRTEFLLSLQNPVWRGSRAEAIGRGLLFHGDANHFQKRLARIARATGPELQSAGRRWLDREGYVLHVLPQGSLTAAGQIDRTATIAPAPAPELSLPDIEERTLAGGGKLIVAARPDLPLARVTLAFAAGSGSDDASTGGRARAVLSSLPEIEVRPGITLAEAMTELGSEIGTDLDRDFASLAFTVLREQLEPAVGLVVKALARGPSDALLADALQDLRESMAGARANASSRRLRVLACALASPCNEGLIDGLGSEKSLQSLTPASLRDFYKARYNTANAVAIVTGAADASRLATLLQANLPTGSAAAPPPALVARPDVPRVTVIDAPGAAQASVYFVQMLPHGLAADPLPAELTTLVFRQRLMDVLRTDRGWSYEMFPYGNRVGRSGSYLYMNMPVQTDKVALAIREVEKVAASLRAAPWEPRLIPKGYLQGSLLTGLTSLQSMNDLLLEAARGGLKRDYYRDYLARLPSVSPDQVHESARAFLDPDRFVWAIAGDLKVVGPALEAEKIPFVVAKAVP